MQDYDEAILVEFEEALSQSALSSSTIVNYLADLRTFLRWGQQQAGAQFSLGQVTSGHIRLYREHLVHELHRAAATVNRHLMALRKFFAFAVEMGTLTSDPTLGVGLVPDDGQPAPRPLTDDEVERLLAAAQQGSRAGLVRRDLAILHLLLYTGLRVSEIVELQKEDVIFDDPGVRLKVSSGPDSSKARHVPLPGTVCRALVGYLHVRPQTTFTDSFFLSQEGRAISSRTVQRIIGDCARAAGLVGVSAQSLRRTFALHLLAETNDIGLVSQRLGHQSRTITEQYLSIHGSHNGVNDLSKDVYS